MGGGGWPNSWHQRPACPQGFRPSGGALACSLGGCRSRLGFALGRRPRLHDPTGAGARGLHGARRPSRTLRTCVCLAGSDARAEKFRRSLGRFDGRAPRPEARPSITEGGGPATFLARGCAGAFLGDPGSQGHREHRQLPRWFLGGHPARWALRRTGLASPPLAVHALRDGSRGSPPSKRQHVSRRSWPRARRSRRPASARSTIGVFALSAG